MPKCTNPKNDWPSKSTLDSTDVVWSQDAAGNGVILTKEAFDQLIYSAAPRVVGKYNLNGSSNVDVWRKDIYIDDLSTDYDTGWSADNLDDIVIMPHTTIMVYKANIPSLIDSDKRGSAGGSASRFYWSGAPGSEKLLIFLTDWNALGWTEVIVSLFYIKKASL